MNAASPPASSAPSGPGDEGEVCPKCGTASCLEDARSGWYDDEPVMSFAAAQPAPVSPAASGPGEVLRELIELEDSAASGTTFSTRYAKIRERALAVLAASSRPRAGEASVQARVNPDGFVAQRFDVDFNGRGHWLLMHIVDEVGLTATVFTDEDVEDWAVLAAAQPAPQATDAAPEVNYRYPPGYALIAAERARQVDAEGWTPEHDDRHTNSELLSAAAVYMGELGPSAWPWGDTAPKWSRYGTTAERVRELVKAGALIAAEIDRLQRLTVAAPDTGQLDPERDR